MKILRLPNPPNPSDAAYRGTAGDMKYNSAVYQWMAQSKGLIEQASLVNDTPVNQNFVLGSYVFSTSMAGTSTGTDVNNFILSVVAAFMKKGILTSN